MKSRIAILAEPGRFEISEVDVTPKREQVLVKVTACGLCNWELNHWKGIIGKYPRTLGHEFGGIITELGEGVDNLKEGDLVTGLGAGMRGFADYALFDKNKCFKLNNTINLQHVLGEPLKCILTVLRGASPESGDAGVILGCGPMGLWCIQGLSGNYLSSLIALDINDDRLSLAKSFGATHTINTLKTDAAEAIKDITDGHMADFVIEGTGIPALLNEGMYFLKKGRGRLVLMSSHDDAVKSGFDFRPAIERSIEIRVTHPGFSGDGLDDMRRAALLLNRGVFKMDGIITHTFKLENIQEAFKTLENKPTGYLKGIVVP